MANCIFRFATTIIKNKEHGMTDTEIKELAVKCGADAEIKRLNYLKWK